MTFGTPAFSLPSLPSTLPIVDDDTRTAALRQIEDTLGKIVQICRTLDLPVTHLPQIVEMYVSSVRAITLEKQRVEAEARADRVPMTMTSLDREYQPFRIKPGQIFQAIVRPQNYAYRVQDIEIEGDPSKWRVHDIKVGNMSQFSNKPRPVSGTLFRKGGFMSDLRLATCQTAMDFVLVVEYVGPLPQGEVFEATIVGIASTY